MIQGAGRLSPNRQLMQRAGKGRKRTARGEPLPVGPHCVGYQNMNRLILTFSRIARPIMDVIIEVPP